MGGSGSGRIFRCNARATTENSLPFDIRRIKRDGLLWTGNQLTLRWSTNGNETASIHAEVKEDCLILKYTYKETEKLKYPVYLDWTPCYFGGTRIWLRCPSCNARVAIIYSAGKYFACRKCYNLTYESCNTCDLQKVFDKANKLKEQLGGKAGYDYPVSNKPKGMHWKTYNKIRAEIERLEYKGYVEMMRKLELGF